MIALVIDTSAGTSVALVALTEPATPGAPADAAALAARSVTDPRRHAELLTPMIAEVLAAAGRSVEEVDLVVVGTGPAPFTGLRAGLVTARALARARGVELIGVPSLDALARTVLDALPASPDDGGSSEVVVVTDARRKEVYGARYRAHGGDDARAVVAPVVVRPQDAAAVLGLGGPPAAQADAPGEGPVDGGARALELWPGRQDLPPARVRLAGVGVALYPDALPGDDDLPVAIDLSAMARVARTRRAARAQGEADVPSLDSEPLYLRRPDVHQGGRPR